MVLSQHPEDCAPLARGSAPASDYMQEIGSRDVGWWEVPLFRDRESGEAECAVLRMR